MEADALRLILLALGAALVVGIFLWDRYQRSRTRLKGLSVRKARRQPVFTGRDAEPGMPEQQELPHMRVADDEVEAIQEDDEPGQQHDFSALDEQDYVHPNPDPDIELPSMVIQIGLISKKGNYDGKDILAALKEVELRYGDMGIYHRYQGETANRILFSVASMVEPGYFPKTKRADFETPGLLMFTQLPGVEDGLMIYSDMLYTAERLQALLGGMLQDESRGALSKQQIEHTRDLILEHRRKVQLARMK
jgi:cell division protein ZipA